MNNREKYVKTSSIIEPSADFASKVLKEAEKMNQKNRKITHVGARSPFLLYSGEIRNGEPS